MCILHCIVHNGTFVASQQWLNINTCILYSCNDNSFICSCISIVFFRIPYIFFILSLTISLTLSPIYFSYFSMYYSLYLSLYFYSCYMYIHYLLQSISHTPHPLQLSYSVEYFSPRIRFSFIKFYVLVEYVASTMWNRKHGLIIMSTTNTMIVQSLNYLFSFI